MIEVIENNILFRLGRNSRENFQIIDDADENDWWFHLDDCPSGHCVVSSSIIDTPMIIFASSLVKEYSKLKNTKKVKIIYTQIKNIKKTKTEGEVIILNQSNTITI